MSDKHTVTLEYVGETDKLKRATEQATGAVDEMAGKSKKAHEDLADTTERSSSKMAAALGTAGGFIGNFAAEGVRHLFDLSKNMEALDVKAKTVFEGQLPSIQAWAEQNRKAFGDSTRNVVAMAANLADLLKPMGFTSQQAADMSKKILDLSGALSRWSGGQKTAKEVSEVLADAMLGETDGLKALGISISAAEVDAKALSMGLGKTTVDMFKVKEATLGVEKAQKALNEATKAHGSGSLEARNASLALEKAQNAVEDAMKGGTSEIDDQARALATQQLILDKSTDAQKAWTEGGRKAAEAQNATTSTLAESAEKLAQIVTPVFQKLVEVLAAVADWMMKNQEAATIIGVLVAAIWLLNFALEANPIVLIVSLIAGLVAALTLLWTKSEGFRGAIVMIWDNIRNVVGGTVDFIKSIWNGLVDFFSQIPDRIGRALGTIGEIFSRVFKGAVNIAIDVINWFVRRANDIIYGINIISPFPDIPPIHELARLHRGGEVMGHPGEEKVAILQAGEVVQKAGDATRGGEVYVHGDDSSMYFRMLKQGVRTGKIKGLKFA